MVYSLSIFRNKYSEVIPKRVITRAPTAELAPDQKDTDSLPPYDILDPILEKYIEKDLTPSQIANSKSELFTVEKVASLVDRNEYKRRQAPPGVRITKRAFGRDRRFQSRQNIVRLVKIKIIIPASNFERPLSQGVAGSSVRGLLMCLPLNRSYPLLCKISP